MPLERFASFWREQYVEEASARERRGEDDGCVFCRLLTLGVSNDSGVIAVTELSFVCLNAYPYGSGHVLVLPQRHVAGLDELSDDEADDLFRTVRRTVRALVRAYEPDGENVGFNLGRAGGAGLPSHLHAHALPRWNGDTNFMSSIAETRVLPESLSSTWSKVHDAWTAS